jgi:hypothetical protein
MFHAFDLYRFRIDQNPDGCPLSIRSQAIELTTSRGIAPFPRIRDVPPSRILPMDNGIANISFQACE